MLSLQIYTNPARGRMLADYTGRASGIRFSTNRHGFQSLTTGLVSMSMAEAFQVYEWPATPHVTITNDVAATVWEGRLEDIAVVPGGISLTAFGYQRAYSDVLYTGLWSKTSTADWKAVTEVERASATPQRYEIDNNNRLYIAPRQGESFGNDTNYGELTYTVPHLGSRNVGTFSCDYSVTLPANWDVRIIKCNYDFSGASTVTTLTATGSNQTGTFNLSPSFPPRIIFSIRNNTGSTYTMSADSGAYFARLTNIRVKSTTAASVTASAIAGSLVSYVAAINSEQLSSSTARIQPTTVDLQDEIYEDGTPATILDRLAFLHEYEWSVWDERLLTFQPREGSGTHWYVDVVNGLELQRSLDNVHNAAYANYRTAGGDTFRTGTKTNSESLTRYGIQRTGNLSLQTTSSTEAATYRDIWLADRATAQSRIKIKIDKVYEASGASSPLYYVRAGDMITIRNLPPTLSVDIDRIRTFTVMETSYNAASDTIDVSPYVPTPTLDLMIARQAAGFRRAL